MDDQRRVRNLADGGIQGAVVQAGTIHQVWLAEHSSGSPLVPRQLPPVVRDFTGRTEHLAALDDLLAADQPQTAVITAIDGTAGIGKTTLAVWWAHRVQDEFPDGTLYVNLRGYGPGVPMTTTEVLDGFLRALGVPPERMPAGVEAQAGLFRSLLAGRRVLIVLDNAHHADQVRPLLPGTPGCVVLITSRDSLTGLVITEGASRLTLDLLTETQAVQLVTGVIGPARAAAESAAVTELVRSCARLPLALRIAAGRAAAYPHSTVADVVSELADERARLDILSRDGDERAAVRAVFDSSYQRLSPDHALLFRRLGLHPGPDLTAPAAAALADMDPTTARRMLEELTQAHLLEPASQGRYRFHDLLRAYSLDQTMRCDSLADRDHAMRHLLDWYAHTANTCDTLAFPDYPRLSHAVPVPTNLAPISDRARALAWLTTEQSNLLAALRYTARLGFHQHTLHLAVGVRFLSPMRNWAAALDARSLGVTAAQQSDDRSAEALFLPLRGEVLTSLQRWDEAQSDFNQALVIARDLGDRALQADALNGLGLLRIAQGRFERALLYLYSALPLSRGVGAGRWEAVVEFNLCRAHTGLGQYDQALRHGENGLVLRRRCNDLDGEAVTLHHIARAWQGLGEHQQTITLCREAISLGHAASEFVNAVAEPLDTLAVSLHHTGDTDSAISCWEEAAAIFDQHGEPLRAEEVRERARRAAEGLS